MRRFESDRERTAAALSQQNRLRIIVLTARAGGFGLNLQSASGVIHLDEDWSPGVSAQCTRRCYRKGQKRDCVSVILRSCGSAADAFMSHRIDEKKNDIAQVVESGDFCKAVKKNTNSRKEDLKRLVEESRELSANSVHYKEAGRTSLTCTSRKEENSMLVVDQNDVWRHEEMDKRLEGRGSDLLMQEIDAPDRLEMSEEVEDEEGLDEGDGAENGSKEDLEEGEISEEPEDKFKRRKLD